jgi:hypothetical protein
MGGLANPHLVKGGGLTTPFHYIYGCVWEWIGLDWKKWISTVTDLIDMTNKSKNVLYRKVKFFVL